MWSPKIRKTLNQWIVMYPDEMSHLFDNISPPFSSVVEGRTIYPDLNAAEMLAYCQLRWGDMVLMPIGDENMVAKISRMHDIIAAQSKIIEPKYYYDFYLLTLSPNQLTQNNWTEVTESEKTGEGELSKSGGEYLKHGESVESTQAGSTTTTYRSSTGENTTPRFDRDVTISATDPKTVHGGTDYKGYEDENGSPYGETKSSTENLEKTITHSGLMSKNPIEDNLKLKDLGSAIYEKWIYELIQVISTGTYQ